MCKESLEVGFLFFYPTLPDKIGGISTSIIGVRMPSELKLNRTIIQLQLSFLIATGSVSCADSLGEAAVEVKKTGHGQDNKRSAGGRGLVVLKCPEGGKTLDFCDHKTIKYCERLVRKSINRDKKSCCTLPFYQLSVAKLSLHNSLETMIHY